MTHYEVRTYGWTLMICFCFLIVEYSLQLVSGLSGGGPGYLEILDQGGAWRRICWDSWSQGNAMVACRQLGYQQLVNTSYGEYKAVIIIFFKWAYSCLQGSKLSLLRMLLLVHLLTVLETNSIFKAAHHFNFSKETCVHLGRLSC